MRKNLRRALAKSEMQLSDFSKFEIPYLEWNLKFRKKIEGHANVLKYLPMWHTPYRDESPWQMYCIARQLGKTTFGGGLLAYYGTQLRKKGVYVTFEDESLRSFSSDKYRGSILHPDNPEIFDTIKGGENSKGAVSRVEFRTESSTSLVTDANQMHHIEGKSADLLVFDEVQNLDLGAYEKARESQAWTQGRTVFMGIGGEVGSLHHKFWLSTNQMEYHFKRKDWRNHLEFDKQGLVWGDYLVDLLDGTWIAKAPQNLQRHGYKLTQEMFPNIPLLKKDCEKYHISEEHSIEWKRENYTSTWFQKHVLANFVKGQSRPFSKESMMKLFDKDSSFTRPEDVDHEDGKVYASADWGGGNVSFTIPLITQCVVPEAPIFKVLHIEKMDEPDVEKQADRFIDLCNAYEADHITIDAGGGSRQAQKVETTFANRCTKIAYIARPAMPLPKDSETERLDRENRYIIDRTYSIDRLKDMIDHPYVYGNYAFPKFIIPAADFDKVSWIIDHFEAVEGEMIKLSLTGQEYMRYVHDTSRPDDAVHAFNYNWIGQMIHKKSSEIWWKSF
ncbi:MAG TPA: hypothetical protein VEU72_09350 [Nitrosopumilaceae archaeon]|nr:hypothetical protein [Nitrosopumilaceae archaeon]